MIRPLALSLCLAGAAQAQTACGPYDKAVAHLQSKYKETIRATGLAANGHLMQVFASESGSWPIVIVSPNGWACMRASGQNFEALPTGPEGDAL